MPVVAPPEAAWTATHSPKHDPDMDLTRSSLFAKPSYAAGSSRSVMLEESLPNLQPESSAYVDLEKGRIPENNSMKHTCEYRCYLIV